MSNEQQESSSDLSQSSCPPTSGSDSLARGSQPVAVALSSTNPRWKPNNHEEKLLEFFETLILDQAQSHAAITQQDIAGMARFRRCLKVLQNVD